jgi:hypothetical protein
MAALGSKMLSNVECDRFNASINDAHTVSLDKLPGKVFGTT